MSPAGLSDDAHGRPIGYAEVTVAVAALMPDGLALHDVMTAATVAFGLPSLPLPQSLSDAETQEVITADLARVVAAIQMTLVVNGCTLLGQVAEPMSTRAGKQIGTRRVESPMRLVPLAPEARA